MGTARYSGEFKRDAVALVEPSGRRIPSVARELGVDPESLRQWVARARAEAAAFAEVCRAHGIRRSMGRVGSSYDNALAESFFATLKRELLYGSHWLTRAQARMAVFAWMAWYNRKRRHSALGCHSPIDYEQHHAASVANLDLVA
ncbi:integrase core domain-containing protein [Streptomyces sp. CC208A]|uniref:integrase core domain-containing protein n=1 Tax=Streptomyces sp. CC208A TaxID=3044573 RepID=UPI0024A826CC|nr:integrase core domain-containing protein [Streptomyces sp. CC208A]